MKSLITAVLLAASVVFGVSAATAQPPTPVTYIERVDCDQGCSSSLVTVVAVELEGSMCALVTYGMGTIYDTCKTKGTDSCTWETLCKTKRSQKEDLTYTYACACLEKKTTGSGGGDPDRLVKTGK